MFCAGRVQEDDLKRTQKACGGAIITTVENLNDQSQQIFGTCEVLEEIQMGSERYNLFTGCPKAKTATMILRGGAEQFIDEVERSLHDAIMIVRRAVKNDSIVAGGGAIEMALSRTLRDYSRTIPGKEQLIIAAYAKAFEIIPRQLCENAGFDATNILNKLRQKHAESKKRRKKYFLGYLIYLLIDNIWYGVDIMHEDVSDNFTAAVWEPAVVKINAITAASEAACLILSVDETIKVPKSSAEPSNAAKAMNMD
jgi:T-complex protein 1 subunit eta